MSQKLISVSSHSANNVKSDWGTQQSTVGRQRAICQKINLNVSRNLRKCTGYLELSKLFGEKWYSIQVAITHTLSYILLHFPIIIFSGSYQSVNLNIIASHLFTIIFYMPISDGVTTTIFKCDDDDECLLYLNQTKNNCP